LIKLVFKRCSSFFDTNYYFTLCDFIIVSRHARPLAPSWRRHSSRNWFRTTWKDQDLIAWLEFWLSSYRSQSFCFNCFTRRKSCSTATGRWSLSVVVHVWPGFETLSLNSN
jgi:hypothetical protein